MEKKKYESRKAKRFESKYEGSEPLLLETNEPYKVNISKKKWDAIENDILEQAKIIIDSKTKLQEQIKEESMIYNQDMVFAERIYEGCYQEHIPLCSIMVDAFVSRLKRQVLSVSPTFRIKPLYPTQDPERIDRVEQHMDHQLKVQSRSMIEMDQGLYQIAKHGVMILVPRWEIKRRASHTVEHYDTLEQFIEAFGEEKKNVARGVMRDLSQGKPVDLIVDSIDLLKNNPEIELCHLEDFYVHDSIASLDDAKLMFRMLTKTWNEMQGLKNDHFTDEDLEKFKKTASKERIKNQGEQENAKEDPNLDDVDYRLRPYPIFEGVYITDLNNDEVEEMYLVRFSMEHNKMITFDHFPYAHSRPPFIPIVAIPKEKSWRGYSIIEKVRKVNRLVDIVWNQVLNINDSSAYPIIKARLQGSFDPDKHPIGPFKIWWLKDINNDIGIEKLPTVPIQTLTLLQESLRFAELVSGIPFISLGLPSPKDEEAPATKALLLRNEANIRIVDMIDRVKRDLSEVGFQVHELNSQYLPLEDEFPIMNPRTGEAPYKKISRRDYMVRDIVSIEGISAFNSWESETIAIDRLLMRLMQFPTLTIEKYPEGILQLIRDGAKRAGFQNPDRYIPTDEILRQMREQAMMDALAKKEQMDQQKRMEDAQVAEEVENVKDEGVIQFLAGRFAKKAQDQQVAEEVENIKDEGAMEAILGEILRQGPPRPDKGETNGSASSE